MMEYQGRGPWTIQTSGDGSFHDIEAPYGEPGETFTVARVFGVKLDNARLIANAPDMLLAAEDLVAALLARSAVSLDDLDDLAGELGEFAYGPFRTLVSIIDSVRGL